MKIVIDTDSIANLVVDSGKLIINQKAEDKLLKLIELQEQIEQAISQAKSLIIDEALKIDPNFTSIKGEKVTATYQVYGSKYWIDTSKVMDMPAELVKTKTTYSLNTEALETWLESHDGLPDGVNITDREKHLVIRTRKAVNE